MSLLQGDPLPNITTTKSTDTKGPDWYNQYLESLAAPGTALLGKTGEELVSPMSELQTGALSAAPSDLSRYEDLMSKAGSTAELAAKGITPEMIQSYMNPYTSSVVDEMGRLQQQSLQRNLLPSLKTAFAGTGGFGSSRMSGALGQAIADMQANLTGQQQKALETGYSKALDTAAAQAGLTRQAAETERGVAQSDLDAAIKALEEQYGLGSKQQQFEQSKILAPVSAAKSAADVYSNLKVPTTVAETANAPIPGAYATSPLAQIAGLGSLFASGSGGTSAADGFIKALTGSSGGSGGILGDLKNWWNNIGSNTSGTIDYTYTGGSSGATADTTATGAENYGANI
jgi:hypothetical protein